MGEMTMKSMHLAFIGERTLNGMVDNSSVDSSAIHLGLVQAWARPRRVIGRHPSRGIEILTGETSWTHVQVEMTWWEVVVLQTVYRIFKERGLKLGWEML